MKKIINFILVLGVLFFVFQFGVNLFKSKHSIDYSIKVDDQQISIHEEYFKDKKYPIKHSLLYYQFVFGTASVIIGLSMICGLIYYFWGGLVLGIFLIATFIYSCIGIYKFCNVNLF